MHILQALRERKSDQALFETCSYLSANNTEALEDEWVAILAEIGMSAALTASKHLWIQLIDDLLFLVTADAIDVTDALICTTKLYLLYQRTATSTADSIARLRARVIEHFPPDARLSYKGVHLFQQILPEANGDEAAAQLHDFAHRILSGFIKLFHGQHTMTGNAIEFIARKKMAIPLPRVWPSPNPQESGRGDPVWFTWGALLLYFPNDLFVQTAWTLFSLRWKNKYKMERLGLLVGAGSCAATDTNASATWTHDEVAIIENLAQLAPDLWAAHTPPPPMKSTATLTSTVSPIMGGFQDDNVGISKSDNFDIISDFVPRVTQQAARCESSDSTPDEHQVKIINITADNKKGSKTLDGLINVKQDGLNGAYGAYGALDSGHKRRQGHKTQI